MADRRISGNCVALGYRSIFSQEIFARWVVGYVFGIVFQYFTIAPMRGLSPGKGIMAAIKADTLSLTAWQIGMYGFMAIAHFVVFLNRLLGRSSSQHRPSIGS
jgi:hypothetical protein